MENLKVFYKTYLVGDIVKNPTGFGFRYTKDWLKFEKSFAISQSLPLADTIYLSAGENFFSNLLPEGLARQAICQKFGISIDNDLALLERIGHECAGALTIAFKNTQNTTKKEKIEITAKDFKDLLSKDATVYTGLQNDQDFPFSLAGAQDKIPVIFENQKFYRPQALQASTHILKFAQTRFKFVAENEFICSLMLESFDLPVPATQLIKFNSQNHLLVSRYDRKVNSQVRYHQEDFCQALGTSYKKKYEKESGLKFQDAFFKLESISNLKSPTVDLDLLIRWQILNVFLGNCDGHLKNISLLMDEDQQWGLAPFYDVVMTLIYPKVSKKLAFLIAEQADPGNLYEKHWQSFFRALKVSPPFYIKQITAISEQILDHFTNIRLYFESEYGSSPVLDMMEKQLIQNVRRVRLGLGLRPYL